MLKPHCFSREWISKKQKEFAVQDAKILETSIHAFALLANLSSSGLNFIFHGGTSLLLYLRQIRRLSVDIDIICGVPKADLDSFLQSISTKSPFIGYKEDDRGDRGLPNRRHFKFFYNKIDGGNQSEILLDIVVEKECELPRIDLPIIAPFIEIEKEFLVSVPTVEGLLGEKLTAFAPNTIGVPFKNKKGETQNMQVAKQLFDVGELFGVAKNMQEAIYAYQVNFKKENKYRDNIYPIDTVLTDTIATSFHYCGLGLEGFPDNKDAGRLNDGTLRLSSHLIGNKFDLISHQKIAAAKAALLSTIIKKGRTDLSLPEMRFSEKNIEEIRLTDLRGEFARLIRLRNTNPEAYYYWLMLEKLG